MHERFEKRIEEGLRRIEAGCPKQHLKPLVVAQRVGRLMGQNSRAAGLFQTVARGEKGGHFRGHRGPGQRLRNRARIGTRPEGRERRLKTLAAKLSQPDTDDLPSSRNLAI